MVMVATSDSEGESRRCLPRRAPDLGVLLADQLGLLGEHLQIDPISAMPGSFCAQVTRWLKDPKFAFAHAHWEASVWAWAEKRSQRRGQRRNR